MAENPDLSLSDLIDAIAQAAAGGSPPEGVPPFLYALSIWPYTDGMAYVGTLAGTGGIGGRRPGVRAVPGLDRAGDPPRPIPRAIDRPPSTCPT